MGNKTVPVAILMVIVVLILGMSWGAIVGGYEVKRITCRGLGFDGMVREGNEIFCYVACPYDLAVSGECQPGDSGVEHVNPD